MARIRKNRAEEFQHICLRCKISFKTKKKTSVYCSRSCNMIYRNSPSHEPGTPEKTLILSKIWRSNNRDRHNYLQRKYRKKNTINPEWREKERQYKRDYNKKSRIAAFMAYGGMICSCNHHGKPCGPHPYEFLAIDHINGDGKMDGARDGDQLVRRLKKLGYPPGFRVLCHNCNSALGFHGFCPMSDTETQQRKIKVLTPR